MTWPKRLLSNSLFFALILCQFVSLSIEETRSRQLQNMVCNLLKNSIFLFSFDYFWFHSRPIFDQFSPSCLKSSARPRNGPSCTVIVLYSSLKISWSAEKLRKCSTLFSKWFPETQVSSSLIQFCQSFRRHLT